jgi:hypothetical protein
VFLSSCDGGLFGTGDGHNNDMMIDGIGDTNSDNMNENPGTTTGGTDVEGDNQGNIDFDNLTPSSQISTPQLRVINLSDAELSISANELNSTALSTVATGDDSGRIDLPLGVNSLFFSINTENAQTEVIQTFSRFNVADFTLTTVIVRGSSDTNVDVIPLVTRAISTSPDTALARLVQTNELGDATRATAISLIAVAPINSGSDVSFPALSYESVATEYSDVLPGSYTLTDPDNRFVNENITIEAGKVYTIVINKASTPALRVIVDSD